ncbi:Coiled-coil domain-containing protein 47 [Nymphon striatum]|nr:Coiled-coil domain-containing protein 47 [Nymphon striatum]
MFFFIAVFNMNYKFYLFLLFVVELFTSSYAVGNKHGADTEDNEFAEFEEFDTEDEFDQASPPGQPAEDKTAKPPTPKVEIVDDDDDGRVENEDDHNAEEFDHFNDEEEFENYEHDSNSRKMGQKESTPSLKITNVPLHLHTNWESFYLEILMALGLVVYFINFIIGRIKNQNLASAWFNAHKQILESNFSLVGDDGKNENSNPGLIKDSENIYTLWCSGRTCCEGMLVQLKFLKRQDIISIIAQLFRPVTDQINIKVTLTADCMDTFVFALAKKKTANKIGKEMMDLSTFCSEKKSVEKYGLPSNLIMLSELGEVSSAILDSKMIAVINRHPNALDYIHISDQYSGAKVQEEVTPTKLPDTKRVMIFNFNLPNSQGRAEDMEAMKPLLQLVFYMIDKVKRFRLSREGKQKSERHRIKVEEAFLKTTHNQRQEAAQQRREDRRRAEKERILNEDDPEKQRKWEERDQRREMKKKTPKMKQLKVKAL